MGSYNEEKEEEERFFESCEEEISSVSDLGSTCNEDDCSSIVEFDNNFSQYDIWIKSPESVHDRRSRFLKWMGLSLDQNTIAQEESLDRSLSEVQLGIDRMMDSGGAVLRNSGFEDGISSFSSQSPMSSQSIETRESFENGRMDDNLVCKTRNSDDGTELGHDKNGICSGLQEVNRSPSFEEHRRTTGASPLIQRLLHKYVNEAREMMEAKKKAKKSWLRRLGRSNRPTKIDDRNGGAALKSDNESTVESKMQRVKVYPSKKRSKELSSLYAGQEFLAHNGSILTMKFSLDGQYLASGGEDGVVRVWKVVEDDRLDQFHIPANDSSCLYFSMNHLSKIAPIDVDKTKTDKTKKHISSDSTCVIFPPKVFRVLEKPLHEFQGHSGEVLDLSWSNSRVSTFWKYASFPG